MGLFNRRLMREPKVTGMATPKNILTALGLILIISIPFGFLGGSGKFNFWICFLTIGFMGPAVLAAIMAPLLSGTLVQLREDMIVHGPRGTNSNRSAYSDSDCIYYTRHCSYSIVQNNFVVIAGPKSPGKPSFTNFQVVNRNEGFCSARRFAVPDNVNLEQVLKILRDKGVKVIETPTDISLRNQSI